METVMIIFWQILKMFLLAGLGALLYRGKLITREGSKALGNILIYLALPAVIINSFLVDRTPERLTEMLCSAGMALGLLLVAILISRLFFRKDPIAAFAGAFSNPGFFGVPLIVASAGQGSVFYVAFFIAFLNILQWTYGVSILNGQPVRQGLTAGKLIRAPFIIAILVGLLLFLTRIQLPEVISGCVTTVASLNTPLAMLTVGIYLAQSDLKQMIRKTSLYFVAAVRLLLIPAVSILLLSLLPQTMYQMKMALLMAAACPVGSNVAVYAQLHGKDYPYAVETVVVSTLFSILTIPAAIRIAEMIW